MNTNIQYEAMSYAMNAHLGQYRDDGAPFIIHPSKTASIISLVTDDPEIIAAAWLHDTIEDTDTTYEDLKETFGERIADLVNEVTHETGANGEHYFPRLKSRDAIMLKMADRLTNIADMKGWDEKRQQHYLKKTKFWKTEL